jgi:predicted secreted protein
MSLPLGLAIYFMIWWTVLFAVLPLGVRTQGEEGPIVPGTPESAPAAPRLLRIVILTSLLSLAVFGLVYAVLVWQIVDLGALFPIEPPQR